MCRDICYLMKCQISQEKECPFLDLRMGSVFIAKSYLFVCGVCVKQ